MKMVNAETVKKAVDAWIIKTKGSDASELIDLIAEIDSMARSMSILNDALKFAHSRMIKGDAIGAIGLNAYIERMKGDN